MRGSGGKISRALLGLLVLVGLSGLACRGASAQAGPPEKGVGRSIEVAGVVEASEQAKLYARIAGIVQKVHVDIGDRVKKGQVLAELFVPEIEAELRQKVA